MSIVLINAPILTPDGQSGSTPPLGLAYIGSALREAGYPVSAIDMNLGGLDLRRIALIAEHDRPVLVGISALTKTYPNAVKIARELKSLKPDVKIIIGGSHAMLLPRELLAEEAIDFVATGEGEGTAVRLARHILDGEGELRDIQGLAYKDSDGSIRINENGPLVHPDDVPFPARDLFPTEFYGGKWNVLTARGGCPFKCPFCSASHIWGARRRERTPASVLDEIEGLVTREGADHIFFADDIFTVNKRWVYQVVEGLKTLPSSLTWGCSTRVDCVDRELLEAMASTGCTGVHYGVESGSQRILDRVKGITKAQVLDIIGTTVGVGISVSSSFMVPFPDDTVESLRETKEFAVEVFEAGSDVTLSWTFPYPGTEYRDGAEDLGLKILEERYNQFDERLNVVETKNLSCEQIETAGKGIMRAIERAKIQRALALSRT
ncbi:MAG: B12-binding domain-containing radical SAM protein [Candidatus Aquicultorales bacterium]